MIHGIAIHWHVCMCSSLFSPLRISIFPSVQEDVGLQLFPRCSPLLEIIHHPRGVQRSPSIRIFVQLNQHRVITWPAMPPRCFPPSWKQGPRFAAIDLSRQCRSGVHVAKNWFTDYTSILFRLQARKLWHCSRPNMSILCWITIKKSIVLWCMRVHIKFHTACKAIPGGRIFHAKTPSSPGWQSSGSSVQWWQRKSLFSHDRPLAWAVSGVRIFSCIKIYIPRLCKVS